MNNFDRLDRWYINQCNGDWEHQYGIVIETLDNPGWWVKIDLIGTSLEGKEFEEISEGINKSHHPISDDWIHCRLDNNKFDGAGDPIKLERIISVFLDWAEIDNL